MKFKKILDLISQYKNILFWLVVVIAIALTAIASYPKTTLSMAVHTGVLKLIDKEGRVSPGYEKYFPFLVRKKLEESGVSLKFIAQDSNEIEKSQLEFLVNSTPKIDFTVYGNYGGKLPENVLKNFNSIGIVNVQPWYFYVKKNNGPIHLAKDVQGKKIAFWTSPEGSKNPTFTKGGDKASPYSDDLFLEQFFGLSGVTPENSTLMNVWPKPISFTQEWDIAISPSLPSAKGGDTMSADMYQALLEHKISFFEFEDIESISRNLKLI
jgi:hypothetical protein